MCELVDIKDRAPNEALIRHLESLLAQARDGSLRSYMVVCAWDDDSVNHTWQIDPRNSARRMAGELALAQFDLLTALSIHEGDNVLAEALNGE